jgi:hypothetical protein
MSLEDLEAAWGRRLADVGPAGDTLRELERVRKRARQLEAVVRRRDRIETVCALALVPVFGYFALHAAAPLSRLGSAVLAVACALIPVRLRLARKRAPDPSLPVATFLRRHLELAGRQRRLLSSIAVWYLAPLGIGVVLFVAGTAPLWWTAAYALLVGVFFAYLYRANRAAVRVEIEPRERELRLWLGLIGESGAPDEPGEDDVARRP